MAAVAPDTLGDGRSDVTSSGIDRPRLEETLDEAFGRRLALVVAGAGFGESTLLSVWSRDLESIS